MTYEEFKSLSLPESPTGRQISIECIVEALNECLAELDALGCTMGAAYLDQAIVCLGGVSTGVSPEGF